jgi:hypothetical protein
MKIKKALGQHFDAAPIDVALAVIDPTGLR